MVANKTHDKVCAARAKFSKRHSRAVLFALREAVKQQKQKRLNQQKVVAFRKRKLQQLGLRRIFSVKQNNDIIRNDRILSQAYDAANTEEFFQVQVRKENKMFKSRPVENWSQVNEHNTFSYGTALKFEFWAY